MNKVQKIREVIEKRYAYWREKELNSHSIESEIRMSECQHLLLMLDSLQEEPVSGNIDFEQELYKTFGQVKDFTLGMQIAKRFYNMGRNSKDSQEPVSDDLEEAAYHNCIDRLSKESIEDFKAGAQWKKEQVMAKAIDAELLEGHLIRKKEVTHPLHAGDKVKLIVIKEDEL